MTPETRNAMRESAREHARQMASAQWPGVAILAARWGISGKLVRAIDRAKLPYLTFGESDVRRYDPADVDTYERNEKQGHAA